MGFDKDRIKSSVDIVDVIRRYTGHQIYENCGRLTTHCLSPDHEDRHPSMTISRDKQICYCFACNESYDIFRIVMEYRKVPFVQACKILCKDYHLEPVKSGRQIATDFPLTIAEIKELDPQLLASKKENPIFGRMYSKYKDKYYKESVYNPVSHMYEQKPVINEKGNYIYDAIDIDEYDKEGKYVETHYIAPTQKDFQEGGIFADTIPIPTIFDVWEESPDMALGIMKTKAEDLITNNQKCLEMNLEDLRAKLLNGEDISDEYLAICKEIDTASKDKIKKCQAIYDKLIAKEKSLHITYGSTPKIPKRHKEENGDTPAPPKATVPQIPKKVVFRNKTISKRKGIEERE